MNKESAAASLRRVRGLSVIEQQQQSSEIEEAFYVFWASAPTREEFAGVMGGVLLTARMLWTMSPPGTKSAVTL